jgi:ribosomal protein S18 acetylase RimI-like enzyme
MENVNDTIRVAVPGDEGRIRALFAEMLRSIYHKDDVQGYEAGYLDKYWQGGEDRIYVAELGEVEAFLSVEVHHEEKDYLYLDDLSVAEIYRNRGIGTALIRRAEARARELAIPAIVFHVEKSNEAALRLYERLGWSVFRDDGSRYLMGKEIPGARPGCR